MESLEICKGCNSIKRTNRTCCPDNIWITLEIGDSIIMKSWDDNGCKKTESGHRYKHESRVVTRFSAVSETDVWIHTDSHTFHHSYFLVKESQLKMFTDY